MFSLFKKHKRVSLILCVFVLFSLLNYGVVLAEPDSVTSEGVEVSGEIVTPDEIKASDEIEARDVIEVPEVIRSEVIETPKIVDVPEVVDTTENIATSSHENASSTDGYLNKAIDFVKDILNPEDILDSEKELKEEELKNPDEILEQSENFLIAGENLPDVPVENLEIESAPDDFSDQVLGEGADESHSLPEFTEAVFTQNIFSGREYESPEISENVNHACKPKDFSVDFNGKDRAVLKLYLFNNNLSEEKSVSFNESVIIGSLPEYFDAKFVDNNSYEFQSNENKKYLEIRFIKNTNAPFVDINIPVFYKIKEIVKDSEKNTKEELTMCQINLVNN